MDYDSMTYAELEALQQENMRRRDALREEMALVKEAMDRAAQRERVARLLEAQTVAQAERAEMTSRVN